MQAFLLDRDGVINRERADYVKSWPEFEFLPGSLEALRLLAGLGRPILVITNQSAIGRGIVARDTVEEIHRRMAAKVAAAGGRIDQVFLCPHRPDEGCGCRKPQPGLLFQAAAAYHLDLARCLMVGDSVSDFQAAQAAGSRAILVASGRQGDRLTELLDAGPVPPILPNLENAVQWIRREIQGEKRGRNSVTEPSVS